MKLRRVFSVLLVLCLSISAMIISAGAATKLKIVSLSDDVVTCDYGEKASVTIKAKGDGLRYSWYVKDPGDSKYTKSKDTDKTYQFTMASAKNGRQVYCKVTDKYGNSAKSSTVRFYRLAVVTQPASTSAVGGGTVSTRVKAAGQSVSYRWYYKDPGDSTYTRTNDTDTEFSFIMTSAKNGRKAYCKITDKYGNVVKTHAATFSILKITRQPSDDLGVSGETVSAKVSAKGQGLKYQWYVKDKGESKFSKSKQTTATYSYKMTADKSGRQAYCKITDQYGSTITTNTVTFTRFGITKQPQHAQMENYRTYITMSVTAEGSGLTYQWYYKNIDMANFSPVSGSAGQQSSYSYKLDWTTRGRQSYCIVKDKYGNSVKSNTAVGSMMRIITLPTGACANYGETVSTKAFATGTDITYTWYVKDKGESKYTKSKVTDGTYAFTLTKDKVGRRAYCVIQDSFGNQYKTDSVVFSRLAITKHPQDVAVSKSGKTAKFTVKAVGEGLKYRWYLKQSGDDKKLSCTKSTYSCKVTGMERVYCIVTDKYGNSVESKSALMKIDSGNNNSNNSNDYNRHDCTYCDGYGNCTNCGGDGYYMKWLPGTREYVRVRCDKAFCSGGNCTVCGGDGDV